MVIPTFQRYSGDMSSEKEESRMEPSRSYALLVLCEVAFVPDINSPLHRVRHIKRSFAIRSLATW